MNKSRKVRHVVKLEEGTWSPFMKFKKVTNIIIWTLLFLLLLMGCLWLMMWAVGQAGPGLGV